ncbi:MAG TPA: hypothetical protein PLI95_28610, partial [Polyangiaceae bacterium]|nr:hypothetical protein [Polyangiaceae bacterium]
MRSTSPVDSFAAVGTVEAMTGSTGSERTAADCDGSGGTDDEAMGAPGRLPASKTPEAKTMDAPAAAASNAGTAQALRRGWGSAGAGRWVAGGLGPVDSAMGGTDRGGAAAERGGG